MSHKVLLAMSDPALIGRATALLEEVGDVELVGPATSSGDVIPILNDSGARVVVFDEHLGPLPVMDLARDVNHRMPQIGMVLVARDQDTELLRTAMNAGIRSVVPLPLALSELYGGITSASEWSRAVGEQLQRVTMESGEEFSGRVIGIAGSKGGVGTTTLATQLALELRSRDAERSVCLVDLDLQTGDVRSYLDLTHRRSLTDLVDVAAELTTGHLQDAMFTHSSGLRVLLPPVSGEEAEDLDHRITTRIVGGIRARFDVVVIDLGSITTEASAAAAELADELLVVTTPDVVSLRGANRLLGLWKRLHVPAEDNARAVLNRVGRDREVTPQLAERVLRTPVLATTIPESSKDLEAATNTGIPERVGGAVATAIGALTDELGRSRRPAEDVATDSQTGIETRVAAGELGAVSVDFVASLFTVVAILMLMWQFVLSGYTYVLAQHAAREGAREVALAASDGQVRSVVAEDLPGGWASELRPGDVRIGSDEVEVTLRVPVLVPGLSSPWEITTTAGTVLESAQERP